MITLQNIIFPDPDICTEHTLYFKLNEFAAYESGRKTIRVTPGGGVSFGTYFNAFNIEKWQSGCTLDGVFLNLTGEGTFEIKVFHADPNKSWEVIYCEVDTLNANSPFLADLSKHVGDHVKGLVYVELKALGDGIISGGSFLTGLTAAPKSLPTLAISITTFKRESAVLDTISRLKTFLSDYAYRDQIKTFIIDNGQSLGPSDTENITILPNKNLGGAGGFSRGLIEAERSGLTFCLFMDDDATFHMENIQRTFAFLLLARSEKTAIAGAMISNTNKWKMWENGAIFDRKCRPIASGTDLRDVRQVLDMESDVMWRGNDKLYGGWWFFAFPIKSVKHYPFPFFVRGDDVSFCLSNDFDIWTLNGVVSFQDHFFDKECPLNWYLDLRSHIVHHLALPNMERGAIQCANIAVNFFLRNLIKFQYESIEAILLAMKDIRKGPSCFAENPSLSSRRADIRALTNSETWKPVSDLNSQCQRQDYTPSRLARGLFKISANGHLLPFFSIWGKKRTIHPMRRGNYADVWGCSDLLFLNATCEKGYVTRHSKRKFISQLVRFSMSYIAFLWAFRKLRKEYQNQYTEIATNEYWQKTLARDDPKLTDTAV